MRFRFFENESNFAFFLMKFIKALETIMTIFKGSNGVLRWNVSLVKSLLIHEEKSKHLKSLSFIFI